MIENIERTRITESDQRCQLDLLGRWNRRHRDARLDERLDARIHSYELAVRMQRAATDAFDVSQEPAHIRELYGTKVHGRQTLIARRLLERGVRYVQLWHGKGQPWDNHDKIEANHRKLASEIDKPIAALLTDLKQRRDRLLYTSYAADDLLCVDLGGRRVLKKKKNNNRHNPQTSMKKESNRSR